VAKIPHLHEDPYVKERFLQPEEETKLLGYIDQRAVDDTGKKRPEWLYMKHLILFLIDKGFRFSEAFEFTLEGVTADLRHGCTKNTIGRRVPLTDRALEAARFLLNFPHHHELKQRTTPAKPKAASEWCAHRFEKACRGDGN
jgi:hypothetical protein